MDLFDPSALLGPVAAASPCGPDLEYDAAFLAMQEAAAGKPEQQYGDTLIAAQAADWRVVEEQALALAGRTRDLRVAVSLVRAGARQHGWAGAVAGLSLLQGLLERHWDGVHPQLDAADGNDPTMRLNALAPLVHPDEGLADLRAAALTPGRGALTVRDVELASHAAEPLRGEAVADEARVIDALRAACQADAGLAARLAAGAVAVQAIAATVQAHVGPKHGPDFTPLAKLVGCIAAAGTRATGQAAAAADVRTAPGTAVVSIEAPARGPLDIASREDAARALDRICDWLDRHEPSHPAPLLIRRARRLLSKSFLDIVRDLVPEGADAVERLAGRTGD